MIDRNEAIAQDQLVASVRPGYVCVLYPRGAQTRYGILFDQDPPKPTMADAGTDNGFTQFQVTAGGNLMQVPDRPTGQASVLLGAELKPL